MALETGNYINDLVITNPTSSDPKSQGDDHFQLIKKVLKECLNGFTGGILLTATDTGTAAAHVLTPTTALVGYTTGLMLLYRPTNAGTGALTVNVSGLGAKSVKTIAGADPTSGDILVNQPILLMYDGTNFVILAGSEYLSKTGNQTLTGNLTLTGDQTVSGTLAVTGASTFTGDIGGTGGNKKANLASPTFTGTVILPPTGSGSTEAVRKDYADGLVFAAVLPAQSGNAGKYITTDGANASWAGVTTLLTEAVTVTTNNLPALHPSLNLDFANGRTVDPRITFTRASTATRVNAKGLIETVASGVPRIDYDPVTLACNGLLIEEARTNLLTYSEQFDNAAWTKFRSSVTANAAVAPDGTTTADKLVEDNTASNTHYLQQSASATNGATYTLSVYAKAAERTQCKLVLYGASEVYGAVFDLSAGTLAAQSGTGSYTISSVGNGWYRVTITAVCNATTCYGLYYTASGNTATYTGDGTSGLYIWGTQLEAGAFPTSYIPTVASQVTRAADVATMTGTNFSSWYRQDEGSFVIEARGVQGLSPSLVATDDGTSSNRTILYTSGATIPTMRIVASGSEQIVSGSLGTVTVGAAFSVSFGYKINDCAGSVNGGVVASDATVTLPAGQTTLRIGANVSDSSQINGHIARLAYFPKRLTSAELQALSA